MRNMAAKAVGNLGIAVFNANAPTDEEWAEMIQVVKKADLARFRGLSFSDGGAPNSTQRRMMNAALGGKSPLSAVVTHSAMARGVVTAMGWFNPNIKAFAPTELDEALRFLNVNRSEFEFIKLEIRSLVTRLGNQRLACIPKDL